MLFFERGRAGNIKLAWRMGGKGMNSRNGVGGREREPKKKALGEVSDASNGENDVNGKIMRATWVKCGTGAQGVAHSRDR